MVPVNDSFLASKDSENEMKHPAGKKNNPTHQEEKTKRTTWIFYIYLCAMCIRFTGLSILIGLQPTVVRFLLVQLKNSVATFFSILVINRSIVGVIMLPQCPGRMPGNFSPPMEISVANAAEYISLYFPFLIITLHNTAVYC